MKSINQFIKKIDLKAVLIIFVLTTLTMAPLIFQGIICNDELHTFFVRRAGMFELVKDNISTATAKGRTFGGYVDVRGFSFLTKNMYVNRFVDVLLILLAIVLFMRLIHHINGNKYFTWFLGIMLMVCLPVTFEHGAPNAFVAITVIPGIFVITSLLLYWKYLHVKKIKYLVFSMLLFLVSMMQYEFIVTYVLLYYILIIKCKINKKGTDVQNMIKNMIKTAILPTLVTVGYIGAYFLMQKFNASNYSGNTMGFVSVESSLKIISVLAKSAFPGYFLFNEKYRYIKQIYAEQFDYNDFLQIVILLIVVLLSGVIFYIFNKNTEKTNRWSWGGMLVALAFAVIPTLPNSISSMYQGNVTETFFTWLPVSIFLYFSMVYFVCSIIWNVLKNANKYVVIIAVFIISCYVGQIQTMNYIVANQQHEDFQRLQKIENMFDMQMWTNFDGAEVHSEDIFETRNLLAIHDSYWNIYLERNGLKLNITKENGKPLNLYFWEDEYFILTDGGHVIVASPKKLDGYQTIRISEDNYICAEFEGAEIDTDYYVYGFEIKEESAIMIPVEEVILELLNR